ncbi:hypothetical protein FOCC_FOCC004051 [Frankliniella occidentalis]|nr:hypothetical protein FOCC_FOCC004051 [Frankliniella occidentalis]
MDSGVVSDVTLKAEGLSKNEHVESHARVAIAAGLPCYGIKGLSLLYRMLLNLVRIMPDHYMEHHMLLVSGIYLLSQPSLSLEQVDRASNLLKKYVRYFERLYHVQFMGINIHQLAHYEDLNGKICHLFHGTRYVGVQIASAATIVQKLSFVIDEMNESAVKTFCENLRKTRKTYKKLEDIAPGFFVVGTLSAMPCPPLNVIFSDLRIRGGHFQVFTRLWRKGILFVAECYTRATKRQSSFVTFKKDEEIHLGSIKSFVRWSNCQCNKKCVCQPAQYFCLIQEYQRLPWEAHESANDISLAYVNVVHSTPNVVAVPVSNLITLCFHLVINQGLEFERQYIIQRVNDLEDV